MVSTHPRPYIAPLVKDADHREADTAITGSVVLVVEDDMLLRMHAAEMIEEAGFHVVEAADADEAIRMLESRIDVRIMFTDIDMPGSMNGLKLAHAVADRWPPIRIIATSGHFNVRDGDLPTGGRFIPKPYRSNHVISTLCKLDAEAGGAAL
jgi:CheY-like chemotaxis protein